MREVERAERIQSLRALVTASPGDDAFVELALLLAEDPEERGSAREICFRGLNENPRNLRGRLALARLFYLDGLWEFSIRELIELRRLSPLESIEKLLEAFGEVAKPYLEREVLPVETRAVSETPPAPPPSLDEAVMAELDLEEDFLEALEGLDDK